MAAEKDEPMALTLDLYEDDDANSQFCKSIMQALADGSRAPSQAATDLDAWVMSESSCKLRDILEQPDLIEKNDDGRVVRSSIPNASGYVDHFFQSFPNLCSVFPPYHAGQTRIIQFLEALMAMSEHQAPDSFPDGGALGDVNMIPLWSNRGYSTEYFRIGADGWFFPFHFFLSLPLNDTADVEILLKTVQPLDTLARGSRHLAASQRFAGATISLPWHA